MKSDACVTNHNFLHPHGRSGCGIEKEEHVDADTNDDPYFYSQEQARNERSERRN